MMMDKREMANSFLESANKRGQIKILAELNACTEEEIVAVLEDDSRVKPEMLNGWKISKAMKGKKRKPKDAEKQEKQKKEEHAAERTPIIQWGGGTLVKAYAKMRGMQEAELIQLCKDVSALLRMERSASGGGDK